MDLPKGYMVIQYSIWNYIYDISLLRHENITYHYRHALIYHKQFATII
jgi:hypothetical protein